MPNVVITCIDAGNGQAIAGVYVQVTVSDQCASGCWLGCKNWSPITESGNTDANGQFAVGIPLTISGFCDGASVSGSAQANGYATTPFSKPATGEVAGDIVVTASMNAMSSGSGGGGPNGSGQVALTPPPFDYTTIIVPVVIVIVVVIAIVLILKYRKQIVEVIKK